MPISLTLQKEIDAAIESTLIFAPQNAKLKELAARVYNSNRPTFDQVQEAWMLERIEWLIARKRRTIQPLDAEPAQYMLPGMERIPKRLTMKDGRRIARQNAILAQVREYRSLLLAQITKEQKTLATKDPSKDPRIVALDRLIGLMMQYAKPGKTVTVADVMAAERAKQEWKP